MRTKKSQQEKENKNNKQKKQNIEKKRTNTRIISVGIFFVVLYMLIVVYMFSYGLYKKEDILNSEYNNRLSKMESMTVRGNIYSNNGSIIATNDNMNSQKRIYPFGKLFSHVVGYNSNGKMGLEQEMNYYLLKNNASYLNQLKFYIKGSKQYGNSINTTLDVEITKVIYDAMGENKGAVVVMEPSTGKIIAMVSKPDFDPNMIEDNWEDILNSEESELYNRATNGLYPPGSTFKIETLLEYMREDENFNSFSYNCTGSIYANGKTINCINGNAHNENDIKNAFAKSCNSAFAYMGEKLNIEQYKNTAQELLFNTEFDLAFKCKSSSFKLGLESDQTMVMSTAIGQGETLITPMHNCMIVSAIANGGTLMKPYMVNNVVSIDGNIVEKYTPQIYKNLMTREEAEVITDYMKYVVTNGTAYSLREAPYTSAGKTGSAQYDNSEKHHTWFVGFAPADNPEIAVSIILEGGYTGVSGAHEIARKIFDTYLVK